MDELWKSALFEIQLEVSKGTFLTFFKNIDLVSVKDSVATISTPTYMMGEYIEKRYYALIKKVLDKKTGENLSILFVSESKKESQVKKRGDMGPLFTKNLIPPQKSKPSRIRKDYTFSTFAVSESNQLAYTAATTVAENPLGERYNPLYTFGTVGVGKTHLMHAIANSILGSKEDAQVICLTTEEFTNEVVEAIRDKTTTQLRRKFRNADILILDDVQFLSGKERVQEELFHTFNTLVDKGRQVVFSSDRPPYEIKKIEARLASRFEGGLTVDIQPPDFELRCAILLIKSKKYKLDLGFDITKIIAEHITDTRALEGFLLRIVSETAHNKREIDQDLVSKLLGRSKKEDSLVRPDQVIATICEFYNIKPTQLKGVKRDAYLVLPRQVCMYLLREQFGLTNVEVGYLLGGRDHTTVMHGVDKIKTMIEKQGRIKEEILFITNQVKEGATH